MAERFAPIVRDQRAALLGVLGGVSGDDWTRSTACDPWTVKDVAAHLVEGELLFGRLYRGEPGELSPDNQEGVERWRRVDGDTVRYSLWHHGEATQRVIDQRSDQSWRRVVTRAGFEMQLRQALRVHFFELIGHSHDITAALGLPHVWGERAGMAAEYCIRAAPRALAKAAPSGTLGFRVAGLGERWLTGTPEGWRVSLDRVPDCNAVWATDPETLVLATTGRIEPGGALARSEVEGDRGFLRTLLEAWV